MASNPQERTPKQPADHTLKAPTAQATIANTNAWGTRELVTMALMCAIGVLLSFIEFPLLPGVTWLKFDASLVPAMVCGFAYGPAGGLAVGAIGAIIHGILFADLTGCLMNMLVVIGFILPAALVYKRTRTYKAAVLGLILGIIGAVIMAVAGNLLLTPAWLGVPLQAVIDMVIPILIPFNLLKAILNSVLTLAIYKIISNLITPKKDQVKGK
ncbi:MAG: ECF transporter S component [Eggerthellaceae bacterium]|nr:ECF transporter S component [Eggerthellaceae bacterium]